MNNFILPLAECLIIMRLCSRTLGSKSKKWNLLKSFLFFLVVFFVMLTSVLFFDDDSAVWGFSAIMLSMFCFIYSVMFLKGKLHEKLLVCITPVFILYPIKFFISGIFNQFDEPFYLSGLPAALFSTLTFFFVCELMIRTRKRRTYSLSAFQWGIQAACYLITFLIAGLIWNYSDKPLQFLWVYVMIAVLNVLLYIMMSKMQRDNVINEEYKISQIDLAAQEKFVLEARERYSEMRTLRHDMKHYFTTAAELLSDGKYNEAKDYIERVLDEKIIPSAVGVSTGSAVIDAVINNKISVCAQHGIEMKCSIDTVFGGNEIDISILLSNLLDNAINGCDKEHPALELIIGNKKSLTYIIVKNSIEKSVLAENPELNTDDDDDSHGFGIGSVRSIAEKHGGSVEFKEEDNLFIAEVWLEN